MINGFTSKSLIFGLILSFLAIHEAKAQSFAYPSIRYLSPDSQSMGGVSLPLTQEVGNNLFNNPAGLARSTNLHVEALNLDGDLSSKMLSAAGTGMTGLGGLSPTLNKDPNVTYAEGFSNLTAASFGGLGMGILVQERVRAYSDGTNLHYHTVSDVVPALGYGIGLARGVVRLGFSTQYVNEASGINQVASSTSASFLDGISQGHGFSHTASVNFAFPFTYLPTVSIMGRNISGLHFLSGSIASRAKRVSGVPNMQYTSIDAAFNFTVRVSGSVKSLWFVEYDDAMNSISLPFLERIRVGLELGISSAVSLRGGFTGGQFSGGIGFKSQASEISFAYFHDRSPFTSIAYWDTRFALQYKIFLANKNGRERQSESKGR